MSKDVASAIHALAKQVCALGNNGAHTQMGAIENHALEVKKAGDSIQSGLWDVANAINTATRANKLPAPTGRSGGTKMSYGIAEALEAIANQLRVLGLNGASTGMGAIEAHAKATEAAGNSIAYSLDRVAESIEHLANVVHERGKK